MSVCLSSFAEICESIFVSLLAFVRDGWRNRRSRTYPRTEQSILPAGIISHVDLNEILRHKMPFLFYHRPKTEVSRSNIRTRARHTRSVSLAELLSKRCNFRTLLLLLHLSFRNTIYIHPHPPSFSSHNSTKHFPSLPLILGSDHEIMYAHTTTTELHLTSRDLDDLSSSHLAFIALKTIGSQSQLDV